MKYPVIVSLASCVTGDGKSRQTPFYPEFGVGGDKEMQTC